MKETIQTLKNISEYYWVDSIYLVFYILSFVVLFWKRKSMEDGFKVFFSYSIAILILIVYNPIFVKLSFKLFFSSDSEYVRVFYLLPMFWMMAYVLTELISFAKLKKDKCILIIITVVIIISSGTHYRQQGMYVEAENIYKISNSSKNIADTILADSKSKTKILVRGTKEQIWNWEPIYWGIRMYTSDIEISGYFITKEEYGTEGFTEMNPYLNNIKTSYDFEYIVMDNYEPMCKEMQEYGYVELLSTEECVVYKKAND